jgi:acyl carrier protein
LDSLGLVNLIVATEQIVEEEFGIALYLADEKEMTKNTNPFKTIGTFVDYLSSVMERHTNG